MKVFFEVGLNFFFFFREENSFFVIYSFLLFSFSFYHSNIILFSKMVGMT